MDFPGNLLQQESSSVKIVGKCITVPLPAPHLPAVELAAEALLKASNPLVIIGKGIY